MRAYAIAVGAVLVMAAGVWAVLGDIVASWESPDPYANPYGAAISKDHLFILGGNGNVYKVHSASWSVVTSFITPLAGNSKGLAYGAGDDLWVSSKYGALQGEYVYVLNANTGSIKGSFPNSGTYDWGLAPLCTGDGGVGTTALLVADWWALNLKKVDMTSGKVLASCPFPDAYEIGYDWRNRLVWGGLRQVIYGCTTTGSLVATFTSPVPEGMYVGGLAYSGEYLFLAVSYLVYKIHCPVANYGIYPASLGKVKALLR
jgi:hypothetical protein